MSTGIFPGSFQPFHTGQLMVVKGMAAMCSRTIIAVCTPDLEDEKAIFSTEEVREMISAALLAENLVDAEIVFVRNFDEDAEWAEHLLDLAAGDTDVQIWSGNDDVLALFEGMGIATKRIKHVPGHDSEEIRHMIRMHERGWMEKVPAGAIDVVSRHIEGV